MMAWNGDSGGKKGMKFNQFCIENYNNNEPRVNAQQKKKYKKLL